MRNSIFMYTVPNLPKDKSGNCLGRCYKWDGTLTQPKTVMVKYK